jgi:hypothetical protein
MKEKKARKHAELIHKWADDDSLFIEFKITNTGEWAIANHPAWEDETEYRIKPEVLRYRVALFEQDNRCWSCSFDTDKECFDVEKMKFFVKWVSDWIEVEVNE